MNQSELETLVTRLLCTKSITAKEAVELLKLSQPKIEYVERPVYYHDWLYRPYITWSTNTGETSITTGETSTSSYTV